MASGQLSAVLRHMHQLTGSPDGGEPSDAQLLEQFLARHDEGAFTALVRRHGPMVQGVCRRVLHNLHDAEDAFQATFLILTRKAASIGKPAALAGWLHEVARRTALRVRANAATRRLHEGRAADMRPTDFLTAVAWRDLQPILDEEVSRLPEKFRVPFVLCYLEGHTYEKAAAQLKCLPGTISRRLAQARELLRQRLTRRGLALPAGVLAATLSQHAARAALATPLVTSTVKMALGSVAGAGTLSAPVAALVNGGLRAMASTTTRITTALALALGLLGLGAVAHTALRAAQPGDRLQDIAQRKAEPPAPVAKEGAAPASETTIVTGRVLNAAGKPAAGADVAVMGRRKYLPRAGGGIVYPETLAQGKADADGHFRLRVPRLSRKDFHDTCTLAGAKGHGLALQVFDADAAQPAVTLRLNPEQVLHGRLVDLQGLPAAGVKVQVSKMGGTPFKGKTHHVQFGQAPAKLATWPTAATTDATGRFTLHGVPADASVTLQMDGDRFAVQALLVNPDEQERNLLEHNRRVLGEQSLPVLQIKPLPGQPLEIAWSLKPGRILEGAVTYEDTGKPVARAKLVCFVGHRSFSLVSAARKDHQAAVDGRFRIVADTGDFFILVAYPPAGTPYLLRVAELNWPAPNAPRQVVNVSLPRGVLVRGKVTEQPSGKAVAGATVEFVPRRAGNQFRRGSVIGPTDDLKQIALSAADGTFALPVLPGSGHLLINGPTLDYLRSVTTQRHLSRGRDGGRRYYPNALIALDLKADTAVHEVTVTLRRSVTVKGRLVGPDGKPATGAKCFYRDYIPHGYATEPMRTLDVSGGKFELPGLDPDRPQPVFFLDADKQLAAIVVLPVKQTAKPLTVRLQRCGTAVCRPVDGNGQPVAGFKPFVEVIVTPGTTSWQAMLDNDKVAADFAWMANLDRRRHWDIQPDKQGRVTMPTLIPGATLRLLGQVPGRGILDMNRTFTVEAGQTLDLKDIPIPTP